VFHAKNRSHKQRRAIKPFVHWLIQKTSDKKIGTPQNAKGLIQKTSDEKRGNPQNAKELIQKTSVEKEAPRKIQRGSFKRPLMKKEASAKRKGATSNSNRSKP
jgi:hypothetical protein